jgi:hypothetical protein
MARQRLMLDTNIWSRLAEQGQQYQFNQLVRNKQVDVVMPPATLLEVLRTQDRQLRRAVTKLVCRRVWRRLRTEAQAEAAELVAEIGRLRPAWILDQPDLDAITGLERFWLRTIYDLALAHDPELLALNQAVGARERKEISDLQEDQQVRFRSDGFSGHLRRPRSSSRPSQSLQDLRAHAYQEVPKLTGGIPALR